jgi:hypothetical protein
MMILFLSRVVFFVTDYFTPFRTICQEGRKEIHNWEVKPLGNTQILPFARKLTRLFVQKDQNPRSFGEKITDFGCFSLTKVRFHAIMFGKEPSFFQGMTSRAQFRSLLLTVSY